MDCRPKPLPGTIRRRKRKRSAAPSRQQVSAFKVLIAVMVLVLGLAWTIGLLWFSLTMNMKDNKSASASQDNNNADQPPPFIVKLWPSDSSASELDALLTDCPACAPKRGDPPARVLIVRPPGQFGDIMTEFVQKYLEESATEISSSAAPLNDAFPEEYDVLIHIATLPLLLEAFDVLLTAAEPTKALLTADDVLAVVQHLVKWHCRVAAHASQTKSSVLTLDPTISYPLLSENILQHLYNNTQQVPIPRDEFARKTMVHIDEGTSFWTSLLNKGKALRTQESDLPERATALIRKTLKDGKCPEPKTKTGTSWFSLSSPLETLLESLWEVAVSSEVMDEN